MIESFSSEPHYENHLRPIKAKLLELFTIEQLSTTKQVTVVASQKDMEAIDGPIIYVEHGAGQGYSGAIGYSGTLRPGLTRRVVGVICPGETVRRRWLGVLSHDRVVAVGCPKLDPYIGNPPPKGKVLALAWHWDCHVCPETRTAFFEYHELLKTLVPIWRNEGIEILGHGHPRAWASMGLEDFYRSIDVEPVKDEAEIFRRANALMADNTSLLPEFMALDRPVIFLDSPAWRRQVRHGGRFWEWPAGGMTFNPDTLQVFPPELLAHYVSNPGVGGSVSDTIYARRDGGSAQAAAQFIFDITKRS